LWEGEPETYLRTARARLPAGGFLKRFESVATYRPRLPEGSFFAVGTVYFLSSMNESGKTNFSIGLVILTVLLTVYAQVILKWRVRQSGPLPVALADKAAFLTKLLLDPQLLVACSPPLLAVCFGWPR